MDGPGWSDRSAATLAWSHGSRKVRRDGAALLRGPAVVTPDAQVRAGIRPLLPRLWRYALVLSRRRELAEDLVQAACLRALERSAQYRPDTRLDRWLFAILHSIWMNEVRSRRIREGGGFVEAEAVLVEDGAAGVETRLMAGQVLRAVQALPDTQRSTVFLAYVEGLSYREVAEALEIPIGTVMSRLASARERLSGLLGNADEPRAQAGRIAGERG